MLGLTGSVARGDTWIGSDLDIEIIFKGDQPTKVILTEQEVSVDYVYISEENIRDLYPDTVPIYDPKGVMRKAIERLDEKQILKTIGEERPDLFRTYLSLYGMPCTARKAELLLRELEEGLGEIWGYFRGKKVGPPYMIQQHEPEPYFRNRIRPIYEYDKRDFVRIVYTFSVYILLELFKSLGEEDLPNRIFYEAQRFTGPSASWTRRYRKILKLIPETEIPSLVTSANRLYREIKDDITRFLT